MSLTVETFLSGATDETVGASIGTVVSAPADGYVTDLSTATVSGTVSDLTPVTLQVSNGSLKKDETGAFTGTTSLYEFFGYFGLFCSTVLIMRVLVAVLRDGLN